MPVACSQGNWIDLLGIDSKFTIYDQTDCVDLIKKLILQDASDTANKSNASDAGNKSKTVKKVENIKIISA